MAYMMLGESLWQNFKGLYQNYKAQIEVNFKKI